MQHGVTRSDGHLHADGDRPPDMWVCNCHAVTDHEIRDLLESPFINTVEDVGKACGAGTGCGGCRGDIARLCAEATSPALVEPVAIVETTVRVEVRSRTLRSIAG